MKDLKISKELLSEVLKLEVVKHSLFNKSSSSFNITYMQSEDSLKSSWMPINIYEFAFKCKEWAFNNGRYVLESKSYSVKNYKFTKGAFCYTHFPIDGMGNSHWADTEVEAIFKACEWILKEQQ